MVYLSALSFIVLNILFGLSGIYLLRVFLFHPSSEWRIRGMKVPLTPGLIFRQKDYWSKKIHTLLMNLLCECNNYDYESSITGLERKVYNQVLDKFASLKELRYLPPFIIDRVGLLAAQISFEVFRQFIRSFVPFLIEEYKVETYLDLLLQKIDVRVIRNYYLSYVHKYLVYVSASFFFLMGLFNMVVFLIVR